MLGFLALYAGSSAWAQQEKSRGEPKGGLGGGSIVRIRSITGEGGRNLVETPIYSTTISRGSNPAGRWAQISVVYDTEPEWIDELVFQYYALCRDKKTENYVLFKGAVSHIEIPQGRSHVSTMFLRPNTLLRYGEVVAVAVEIMGRGEQVAVSHSELPKAKLPPDWWKSPRVTAKDGYLLSRDKTPFAFVNCDDYEAIK